MAKLQAYDSKLARLRVLQLRQTHTRGLLFALTLIVFGVALGSLGNGAADTAVASKVINISLPGYPLSDKNSRNRDAFQAPVGKPAKVPANTPLGTGHDTEFWEEVSVQPGQSLDAIFHQQGFSAKTLHAILALNAETRHLKKIRPGDLFEFQRHPDGSLMRMRYGTDEGHYLLVSYADKQAVASTSARALIARREEATGSIDSSLFLAGKQAGLSDAMVMKLANLFGWDIDFVLDIRAGDKFYLIYEKIYRDGTFLRDGEIIAATFINQGEKFQAIRFKIDGKTQYYAPDGRNMRKAFLRAPLNFSYISSNFNPKRFHPILKRVKPHNGIDYRAPRGTPVYAAGEGKVIHSTYNKYNGNYVFIQHANNIVTKYLHFSRRAVKKGQRVKQGQVIGYVGSTGLAEAPHLHYEFVVNGVHRNPRTVPLPKAVALKGQQLKDFLAHTAAVVSQLSRLESVALYATSE